MYNKKRAVAVLCATVALFTSGCSSTVNELNSMQAANSDSSISTNYNLSYSDEQSRVYAQVSSRQLLDVSTLEACKTEDLVTIKSYMDNIDNLLTGQSDDTSVLSKEMAEYVLTEFEKTPYYWQRSETRIQGIDSESKAVVVDVTYKTIDYPKTVVGDSKIVLGEPNYSTKLQVRYQRYIQILDALLKGNSGVDVGTLQQQFIDNYGQPSDIIASQGGTSRLKTMYDTANQITYNGLIDNESEKGGATMTIRYILVPHYSLGINMGAKCKHLYILDYKLNSDPTAKLSAFKDEGYQTVTDRVYQLMHSYFTAMDESNHSGLYKLTTKYSSLDKAMDDMFGTAYQKHEGYTVTIFGIDGTNIKCGVEVSTKKRGKGTDMTYPIYKDKYLCDIILDSDSLKINNMTLISRTLTGEPAINEKSADIAGFSNEIDLTDENKKGIEKTLGNFGMVQLQGDYSGTSFSEVVDTSIAVSEVETLKSNMATLQGAKKVIFLTNYQQGTSNYAQLKTRELFQSSDKSIIEANVQYQLIKKSGTWYVTSYTILGSVKLDSTTLTTTGSMYVIEPTKIVSYNSQVVTKSKETGSDKSSSDSDRAYVIKHTEYTPHGRDASTDTGLVLFEASTLTDEDLVNTYNSYIKGYDSWDAFKQALEDNGLMDVYKESVAYILNTTNSRYSDTLESTAAQEKVYSLLDAVDTKDDKLNKTLSDLQSAIGKKE